MIDIIIKLLEITKSKHEYVDIAKGKYAIPTGYKMARWQEGLRKTKK
jgi:hypothetical protein